MNDFSCCCCCHATPCFERVVVNNQPQTTPVYGYFYQNKAQLVATTGAVKFGQSGPVSCITHQACASSVVLERAGVYAAQFSITAKGGTQFALCLNGTVIPGSKYGTKQGECEIGQNQGFVLFEAPAHAVITLVNQTGECVSLPTRTGGKGFDVNASLFIQKIA